MLPHSQSRSGSPRADASARCLFASAARPSRRAIWPSRRWAMPKSGFACTLEIAARFREAVEREVAEASIQVNLGDIGSDLKRAVVIRNGGLQAAEIKPHIAAHVSRPARGFCRCRCPNFCHFTRKHKSPVACLKYNRECFLIWLNSRAANVESSNRGPVRVNFLEYLLVGIASSLFSHELLNREGHRRKLKTCHDAFSPVVPANGFIKFFLSISPPILLARSLPGFDQPDFCGDKLVVGFPVGSKVHSPMAIGA
jgi:hypothetical protein